MSDLGTLGGSYSFATAINASGQVAGYAYPAGNGANYATVWNGTVATALTSGNATGINSSGQVTGNLNAAVVWNGATPTYLQSIGGSTFAMGINDSGQVAGYSYTASNAELHATVWNGTAVTDLGTLGAVSSQATAINNAGQVVGYTRTTTGGHAILWNGSVATDLETMGGNSQAKAINNAGQVVGSSQAIGSVAHATLWNGAATTDLNSFLSASDVNAGWVLTSASGINDLGWVVGDATNTYTRSSHAFLLSVTAVPEPESIAMLLAGLGLIAATYKRRKAK
jgi:probable HAF family extracellular repeat protein